MRDFADLTLDKGLTDEEALVEIGKSRAMERMREQNEAALRKASAKLSQAVVAGRNAERRALTANTIHPESETGKRLAREKLEAARAALKADDRPVVDPNWVAPDFTNIPAWNPA